MFKLCDMFKDLNIYLKWRKRKFRIQNFLWKISLEEVEGRVSKNIFGKLWMY